MRLLVVLLAAASSAVAESVLDYTKLPACARQCTVLAQAEGGCVPPAAPVTNQAIYQSCVCQSALLTDLHSSGAACQATGCSADDAAKISTYYNALCNGPVVVPVATTTLATSTSTSATSKPTSTAGTGAAGNNLTDTNKKQTWIDRTWRWLVFIIVVIVAMIGATVLGIWLKRRHDRKVDARKANVAAHPDPPPPGTASRSRPGTGFLRSPLSRNSDSATIVNGVAPTPPMTAVSAMSLGPSNRDLDGGVGAIAPPRQPNKLRSRSSTLQSLGLSNSSRANVADPVAWGPHQYAALYKNDRTAGESAPPSPVSAIMPPPANPVFRNREFVASEPRFHPSAPSRNWTPSLAGSEIDRPHTAGAVEQGAANGEPAPIHESRAMAESRRVSSSFVGSHPSISELANAAPQQAEICHQ